MTKPTTPNAFRVAADPGDQATLEAEFLEHVRAVDPDQDRLAVLSMRLGYPSCADEWCQRQLAKEAEMAVALKVAEQAEGDLSVARAELDALRRFSPPTVAQAKERGRALADLERRVGRLTYEASLAGQLRYFLGGLRNYAPQLFGTPRRSVQPLWNSLRLGRVGD